MVFVSSAGTFIPRPRSWFSEVEVTLAELYDLLKQGGDPLDANFYLHIGFRS